VGLDRHVSSISKDDFAFWIAAETERGRLNDKSIKKATIKRGLNTIRAALRHAAETYPDLKSFQVPRSPLTKKVEQERDRVLSDKEIADISAALATKPEWREALFFFQLDLITAARMAELLRMRWEESQVSFGTVKLYCSKTKKWRTITSPAGAAIAPFASSFVRRGLKTLDHPSVSPHNCWRPSGSIVHPPSRITG
jgi:integrase